MTEWTAFFDQALILIEVSLLTEDTLMLVEASFAGIFAKLALVSQIRCIVLLRTLRVATFFKHIESVETTHALSL